MKPCRATTCTVLIPDRTVMCARHWSLVPEPLQPIIQDGGGLEHVYALAAALTIIADAEQRNPFEDPMVVFSHRLKAPTAAEAA